MSAAETAIPYEKQSDLQNNRTCGAACLSMVYRSFGKEVPQSEIWPAIAKVNRFGSVASTTHLMAQDALTRGFAAVAIQARYPLQVLRQCRESGVRAILNHRLEKDSSAGHYSVFVDIDDKSVTLHDPFFGPSQRFSHAELLNLWQPRLSNSEIIGNVLIGITSQPSPESECWLCHTPVPSGAECPNCKKIVSLRPAAVLGCTNNVCLTRLWNYLCCPFCDYTWAFSFAARQSGTFIPSVAPGMSSPGVSGPASAAPQAAPESQADPWKLDQLFVELDKFCNHVLTTPAAANTPDVKQQLDFIAASKEKLKLAQAEELAHQKTRFEQLAQIQEVAKRAKESHLKKLEELNKPSPPLDGDALGRALLKNLGLSK
jgi:Peptidase C39 family